MTWFLMSMKRLLLPALAIWLIGWLWLGGVFSITGQAIYNGFANWTADHGMVVADVMIEGRNRTNLKDLKAAIAVDRGDPLLSLDLETIQNRIDALTWVQSARVARRYNGIVTVTLTERIPFVVWERPGRKTVLVDTQGTIIEGVNPDQFSSLLKVRGVDAPRHTIDLIRMIMAEPKVADHIRAAEWIGDRRWDLISNDDIRIHLPEEDMGLALSRLAKVQEEKNILSQPLLSIDLRLNDRMIVEPKTGAVQNIKTSVRTSQI